MTKHELNEKALTAAIAAAADCRENGDEGRV